MAPQLSTWQYFCRNGNCLAAPGGGWLSDGEAVEAMRIHDIQVDHACTLSVPIPPYNQPQYSWNGALETFNRTVSFNDVETFYNNTVPACAAGSTSYDIWFERSRTAYCAYGQGTDGNSYCALGVINPEKNRGESTRCLGNSINVGNPINAGTGNKFQNESDYLGAGSFPLQLVRYYNSATNIQHSTNPSSQVGPAWWMGLGWRHSYERQIDFVQLAGLSTAFAYRPNGTVIYFHLQNGAFVADADIPAHLIQLTDGAGNTVGWQYESTLDDQIEHYDAGGKLTSIANRAGLVQTISYDSYGRVKTVTDPQGRQLTFNYDLYLMRLISISDPSGKLYTFSYGNGQLQTVTYPDLHSRTYLYDEVAFINANGLYNQLTGITDENGVRYATYRYDAQGRAYDEDHGSGAGGGLIDHYNLT
ncbi:MAG: DUF6531 domain-containing protein, partial [Sulfuriferula sp.]